MKYAWCTVPRAHRGVRTAAASRERALGCLRRTLQSQAAPLQNYGVWLSALVFGLAKKKKVKPKDTSFKTY